MKRALLGFALLVGCVDNDPQPMQDEWSGSPYAAPVAPHCPAPGTPQAVAYVDHGGSSNALGWWLAFHALNSSTHTYHEVHHYYPTPSVAPVQSSRSSWGWGRATQPTRATVTLRPAPSTVTRVSSPSTTYKAPSPSPASVAPKSSSYGFRSVTNTFKPSSSTSFRSASSATSYRPSSVSRSFRR